MQIPLSVKEAIECLEELFYIYNSQEKISIRQLLNHNGMIAYHNTMGRYIRNSWNLWKDSSSPLKTELISLGSGEHPDNMSMFILYAFYYHVKFPNKSIENIINEYVIKKLLE